MARMLSHTVRGACLWMAMFSTFSFAQQQSENSPVSAVVEGICKLGVKQSDGRWDCRLSDAKSLAELQCPEGRIGFIDPELRSLIEGGQSMPRLIALVKKNMGSIGLPATITWLECQGFSIHANTYDNQRVEKVQTLRTLVVGVWLKRNNADLAKLLLAWEATKDNAYCVLWIVCGDPGELHIEFVFDETGNIIAERAYYSTEGT
jgi:hypothetical protein